MGQEGLLDDLRRELSAGNVLVVAGTGVSIQASGGDPRASWKGLIRNGIDFCARRSLLADDEAAALRAKLNEPNTQLEVAQRLTEVLRDGDFRQWLNESVGRLALDDPEIVAAVHAIGARLATTNYDDLLSRDRSLPAVPWTDVPAALGMLRSNSPGVLHLHGYFRQPASIIFDARSYQKILEERGAQAIQQALAAMRTLLFIGCGDGLDDPNVGALLDWSAATFGGAAHSHYVLCRKGEAKPRGAQLKFIEYGEKFSDLAPFLRRELAKTIRASLPPAGFCFGRDEQVKSLTKELLKKNPQPIPILGGPGMGKTTIALTALHQEKVAKCFGARRFFVRLDGATTRNDVAGAIALAMAIPITPNVEHEVLNELASAPAALVLDNAETPLNTDRTAVEALLEALSAIGSLALVVTIRAMERPRSVAWGLTLGAEQLAEADARKAFLAAAGNQRFAADPFLPDLLKVLDGVPLAITLMAHFAESFSSLKLVWKQWQAKRTAMLKDDPDGGRLHDISVSYELSIGILSERARRLLSVLALLPDGVAQRDLTGIFDDPDGDAALELRRKALVVDEEDRLRMRAPLREYVAATYSPEASDEEHAVRHYLAVAGDEGAKVGRAGGAEAVARLAPEVANMEEMLARSGDQPAIDKAVYGWGTFMRFTGLGTDRPIEQIGHRASAAGMTALAARCAQALGDIALARSNPERARERYEEALPLYRDVKDLRAEANCIKGLGDVALGRSDYQQARQRYEEAIPLFRQVGSLLGEANCTHDLGNIAFECSDHDLAGRRYEEALSLYRRLEEPLGEANCIRRLGDIAVERSDHEQAQLRYEQAVSLYQRVGDALGKANCIFTVGSIALRRSNYEQARQSYAGALPLYRQVGSLLGEANCIQGLGDIARAAEDTASAKARYAAALAIYKRIKEPYSIGNAHERLAQLTQGAERAAHVAAAREAWASIQRDDLVAELDEEFP